MRRHVALLLALALVAGGAAPALAQTTLEKIARTGVLTIGTRTGSPPFAYVDKANQWVGFSIDLVEQGVLPHLFGYLKSVHPRQADVQKHHVRSEIEGRFHCSRAVVSCPNSMP